MTIYKWHVHANQTMWEPNESITFLQLVAEDYWWYIRQNGDLKLLVYFRLRILLDHCRSLSETYLHAAVVRKFVVYNITVSSYGLPLHRNNPMVFLIKLLKLKTSESLPR